MKPYSEYKDSGVEWVGNMPSHWDSLRFKYSVQLINEKSESDGFDFRVALENIESGTGNLLQSKGVSFEGMGNIFCKGDVLFNKLRPYLRKATIALQDGIGVGELLVLRPRKESDSRFVLYRVLANDFISAVNGSTYGSKMPRANWDFIGNLKIASPSADEQQAIADYLDDKTAKIDALVDTKRKQIELLKEQRTAVINQAVTKGLDPNAEMKDSGIEWLGEIPKHWEVKRLKHVSPNVSVGLVINPSTYVNENGTVPFLFGSNIADYQINVEKARRITEESNEIISKSKVYAGDLVVVRVGYPGVTAVIPKHLDGCNCASMMIVRKGKDFVSDFLCYCMNSRVGRFQIGQVQYGAAQKQYNISHAVDFVFPLPPYDEQEEVVGYIKSEYERIAMAVEKAEKQIELLTEYRTALISEAVTGKIDVRVN